MEDITAFIHRVLRGPENVLASPQTMRKAIEKGHNIKHYKDLSLDEALDVLFDHRKNNAIEEAKNIPPCPTWETPIQILYDDIRQCLLFGLPGTAILLCGTLVEFMIKYATHRIEQKGSIDWNSDRWAEFEDMTFVPAIIRARQAKIIDDDMVDSLRAFARGVRNPYAHFNFQKLTKGAIFRKVRVLNIDTEHTEERDIPVSQNPSLQLLAKQKLDKEQVYDVFEYTDTVVKYFVQKMSELS